MNFSLSHSAEEFVHGIFIIVCSKTGAQPEPERSRRR
jgi:hypothetical protein